MKSSESISKTRICRRKTNQITSRLDKIKVQKHKEEHGQLQAALAANQAGFFAGEKITVKCQQGQLTITKDGTRADSGE